MKTIGLIGGMSWESSLEYYRIINKRINNQAGGLTSAECIMYSVNFAEIEYLQRNNEWDKAATILVNIAKKLESVGADCVLICTNTMHKIASHVQEAIKVPLIHIGEATSEAISEDNISKIGLLGTRYTMEEDFYHDSLDQRGIQVVTPDQTARAELNRIIFEELCQGEFLAESKQKIQSMIENLRLAGAKAIVLGCTEIPLIIKQEDCSLPLYNTMDIHARKAVEFSLG
ncbi:aspartate/glutamate racemase family protein [Virgibacillus necropolis]|uniref:Aspartate racemase n=1 Tax=Virgibacillus necropolis TaxID=163877 RepID=A0A221MAK5_9BACI|nr:aspartate/glutamate racemase family protein [Virgibacillus necropolis]ASN04696.1 aspartate racemase [Virgibacillus necropolis]